MQPTLQTVKQGEKTIHLHVLGVTPLLVGRLGTSRELDRIIKFANPTPPHKHAVLMYPRRGQFWMFCTLKRVWQRTTPPSLVKLIEHVAFPAWLPFELWPQRPTLAWSPTCDMSLLTWSLKANCDHCIAHDTQNQVLVKSPMFRLHIQSRSLNFGERHLHPRTYW